MCICHQPTTYCHRLVGYVEEEACSTYTKIIGGIEAAPEGSELAAWRTQIAPAIGRAYWHLGEEGTVLDPDARHPRRRGEPQRRARRNHLVRAVWKSRARSSAEVDATIDDPHFRPGMKSPGQINPFFDPEAKLDKMLLKYAHDILDKTPEEVTAASRAS